MNLTEYYKYRALAGVGNSSGGGSETVVTIFDGDAEFERYYNVDMERYAYTAVITPTVEPQSGSNLTVIINGHTVELLDAYPTTGYTAWGDDLSDPTIIVQYVQGDDWWQIDVLDESIMPPSEEQFQTVPVKITQVQSGSGGGGSDSGDSDFGIARVEIGNAISQPTNARIPILDGDAVKVEDKIYPQEFTEIYSIPLYKNGAQIYIEQGDYAIRISGGIEEDVDGYYFVMGDGAIEIRRNINE